MASKAAPSIAASATRIRTSRWFLGYTRARSAWRPRLRRAASQASSTRSAPPCRRRRKRKRRRRRARGSFRGPPPHPRFDLAARKLGPHSHQHDAPKEKRETERRGEQRPQHRRGDGRGAANEADALALVERVPPQDRIMDDRQVDRAHQAEDRRDPPFRALLLLSPGEGDIAEIEE